MPTVEELTDPHLAAYTPVPPVDDGICDVCHSVPSIGYSRCWSCNSAIESVSWPIELIVPISLYLVGGQLHSVLKDYKRSPVERVRERHLWQVAAILHRFVRRHAACIERAAGTAWDVATIVPSKTAHAEPHPLERAILLGTSPGLHYESLLAPDQPETIKRTVGDDRGFKATRDVTGKRILLVDDTFTSGATFQSAASRLALDGATVVAGLVIGRVFTIGDDRYPEKDALWERQRGLGFTFSRCCLGACDSDD